MLGPSVSTIHVTWWQRLFLFYVSIQQHSLLQCWSFTFSHNPSHTIQLLIVLTLYRITHNIASYKVTLYLITHNTASLQCWPFTFLHWPGSGTLHRLWSSQWTSGAAASRARQSRCSAWGWAGIWPRSLQDASGCHSHQARLLRGECIW